MTPAALARATLEDLPVFESLFRRYPFKGFQRETERLNSERLHEFLSEGMRLHLGGGQAAWVVRDGAEPLAAATLSPNPWHGRFYALRMARTHTFLSYLQPSLTTPLLCQAMLEEAERHAYQHLSLRIDGNELENLRLLENYGFALADVSTKMCARIRHAKGHAPKGIHVRPFRAEDRDAIIRISGDSNRANHLFNDPHLDRQTTRELFRAWVERCLDGLAAHVFVAEDESEGIAGFVTYLVNQRLNDELDLRLVVLDYIVLDTHFQGRGIGPVLLEQSLAALSDRYDQVELRTSQNNYAALSLYNHYGFQTLSTDFIVNWFKE